MPSSNNAQLSYNYHCVDSFEIQPTGHRNSGCWTSTSVKLVQLCCIGILIPMIWILVPLHARFNRYTHTTTSLGTMEMRLLDSNISTTWCQGQDLRMNVSFDAYLINSQPSLSSKAEKLSMKRHFVLNDDLKEFWGFYLLRGSEIVLTSCARHLGASVTVIKGRSKLYQCIENSEPNNEETDQSLENNEIVEEEVTEGDLRESKDRQTNSTSQAESSERVNGTLLDITADDTADDRGTLNDQEDDDPTSSSEEALRGCRETVLNQMIVPDRHCSNASDPKKNLIRYIVNEDDYYYVVFSSSYEQEDDENPMTVKFELMKTVFNTSESSAVCVNTTHCHFPLRFASTEKAVIALRKGDDPVDSAGIKDSDSSRDDDTFLIHSECEPRTSLYLLFGLSLPVLLILCAFL